jgi:hypothetical protein
MTGSSSSSVMLSSNSSSSNSIPTRVCVCVHVCVHVCVWEGGVEEHTAGSAHGGSAHRGSARRGITWGHMGSGLVEREPTLDICVYESSTLRTMGSSYTATESSDRTQQGDAAGRNATIVHCAPHNKYTQIHTQQPHTTYRAAHPRALHTTPTHSRHTTVDTQP